MYNVSQVVSQIVAIVRESAIQFRMNLVCFRGPNVDVQAVEDGRFVSLLNLAKLRVLRLTSESSGALRHDLASEAETQRSSLWIAKATADCILYFRHTV